MRIDCDVIKDLLPLYVEDIASEKSRELVDEHLNDCENCRQALEEMRKPDIQIDNNVEPIKKLKKTFRKQRLAVVVVSVFITIMLMSLISFKFFMKPDEVMGWALLYLYVLIPLTSLICCCIVGAGRNNFKWFMPVIFAGIASLYAIFLDPEEILFFASLAFGPSIVGAALGHIIYLIRRNIGK